MNGNWAIPVILSILILGGFGLIQDAYTVTIVVVDVSGTFANDSSDLLGNLPAATFPFPELLGGTFEGSFSYDADAIPVGSRIDFLNVDVDIFDNNGNLIHTIDEGPNKFLIGDGFARADLGQSFGVDAINTPEDLRLMFSGAFVSGVAPSASVMNTATPGTGSFIEVDGTEAFTFWDLPVESFASNVDIPTAGDLQGRAQIAGSCGAEADPPVTDLDTLFNFVPSGDFEITITNPGNAPAEFRATRTACQNDMDTERPCTLKFAADPDVPFADKTELPAGLDSTQLAEVVPAFTPITRQFDWRLELATLEDIVADAGKDQRVTVTVSAICDRDAQGNPNQVCPGATTPDNGVCK